MSTEAQRRKWRDRRTAQRRGKRDRIAAAREAVREALEAMKGVGETLAELLRTRKPGTCAICGRRSRLSVCARADCQTEKERLYQADRRERRRALRGGR